MRVNYIIYGEERATIQKKISQIAARVHVAPDQISVYDASATLLKIILEDVMTLPFFAPHKVVVMRNAAFLQGNGRCFPARARCFLQNLPQRAAAM